MGDADQLWPLVQSLATSHQPSRPGFARVLAEILANQHAALLTATRGGRVIGYVHVMTHPAFHADGPIAWVEELVVDERERGRGTGRSLMSAAEEWGRRRGARYVCLATRRAADFYLAIGYERSAEYFKKVLHPDLPAEA